MAEVTVWQGDITAARVDAIVNAANEHLVAGGGVCGAIFAAAGHDELGESCGVLGGCTTGAAVATPSHRLAERGIRHVIHAVGPRWTAGEASADDDVTADAAYLDVLLASAYRSALSVAESLDVDSIAFPSISTGIFGFPLRRATRIAVAVTTGHRGAIRRIVLVGFDAATTGVLRATLEERPSAPWPPGWADAMFAEQPYQWGLRGDPYLWNELCHVVGAQARPADPAAFRRLLVSWIERLTGSDLTAESANEVRVRRYPTQGMSGGWVSTSFWRDTGLPLLVERFTNGV